MAIQEFIIEHVAAAIMAHGAKMNKSIHVPILATLIGPGRVTKIIIRSPDNTYRFELDVPQD